MTCKNCNKELTKKQIKKAKHKRKEPKFCSVKCCRFFNNKIYKPSEETKRKISNSLKGHLVSQKVRNAISKANKGKKLSENHIENIKKSHLGKPRSEEVKKKIGIKNKLNYSNGKLRKDILKILVDYGKYTKNKTYEELYGVEKSLELKLKRRLNFIKMSKENYDIFFPAYNKRACEFFKNFDENNNTRGRYAIYGGGEYYIEELGYWPDYINFDLKLIIEWDEEKHFTNNNLKEKDLIRQEKIQNHFFDFKFIRVRENDFVVKEAEICQT